MNSHKRLWAALIAVLVGWMLLAFGIIRAALQVPELLH